MRSKTRFSDHTESKLIRSLEHRLSRCQCCYAADLWIVSQTKLIRLQISLGFQRRMLLDVTSIWFSLKASTALSANREENSYFYSNPARYAQKGRAMNENESPDRDRLDCRTTSAKFPISSCCSNRASLSEMLPHHSQLYAEPLFPLLLYIVWIQVVRYFNQKSCAVHNCVIYMVWELPRSLQPFSSTNMRTAGSNSMKRSCTFPRLSHLTSACVAKSQYSPWNFSTNERSCRWFNACAIIKFTVLVAESIVTLRSPPLSLLHSCSWGKIV